MLTLIFGFCLHRSLINSAGFVGDINIQGLLSTHINNRFKDKA